MDQHELVCALKDLAVELGRTPTRGEFESRIKGGKYSLEKHFRNFSVAVSAAGLDTYNERRSGEKITNKVFERDIEQHLEAYEPRPYTPPGPYPTAGVFSDPHWPFHSKRVQKAFIEYVGDEKPMWVILNGDAQDMYSHSKFPRSHNLFTPRDEHAACLALNRAFWESITRAAPKSKRVQMAGNHDIRPMKMVLEKYPAAEDWVSEKLKEDFTFPGVTTILDQRQELMITDKIAVFHGYRASLGAHRDYTLMNCINGHSHVGGVVWRQLRNEVLFELNAGFAGDPESKGFNYTRQRITKWTPGFGALTKRGPIFIPA
jgi:predicted phosphodiesterase